MTSEKRYRIALKTPGWEYLRQGNGSAVWEGTRKQAEEWVTALNADNNGSNYRLIEADDSDHFALPGSEPQGVQEVTTPGDWTKEPPTEEGWYWHWNGCDCCAPFPLSILWSGTSKKCFVSIGNSGISRAVDCDEYGGWWLKIVNPPIPMHLWEGHTHESE